MSDIDWSKAPEGATHWEDASSEAGKSWMKFEDGKWFHWGESGKRWYRDDWISASRIEHLIGKTAAWTGSGLPPVGTVCEFMCTAYGKEREWQPALVKYASPFTVVLDDYSATAGELEGEFVAHPDTMRFRPIRTPEQIAAEERDKAIDAMNKLVGDIEKIPTWRDALAALYDAGWRRI